MKVKALLKLISFMVYELNKIKNAKVIFFFPYYHTGGAEKVHLNIVKAIKDVENYVFFTDESYSDGFKNQFYKCASVYEVYDFLNRNYFVKKLFIKVLVSKINGSKKIKSVFGCHSVFYYELLPHISKKVRKYDLTHAFIKPDKGGIEIFSLPYVKNLDKRIVINSKTKQDYIDLYNLQGLSEFNEKIEVIPNGIEILQKSNNIKNDDFFYVGFVGRWAKEKRPEMYLKIANQVRKDYPDIRFVMAGPNFEENEQAIKDSGIINLGEIKDENILREWYDRMNVILITSYREGFPMVIMESMMFGVIPISSNVGSISEHLIDNVNGFLVENELHITDIENKFSEKIIYLYKNKEVQIQLSKNAKQYGVSKFGIDSFREKYRSLLLN
ncbi:glycosyltransferase family 4 protein [Flavobacterium poyangense]|uniref:glycosyltransferase family 4 protein n=1 Tax=Flavobacterium poyangense TaxID=2204302 RepID=UPI001AB01EB6|nr:glycosyltransferase family 4 protein [Flavobacterium sp. JXAS1]